MGLSILNQMNFKIKRNNVNLIDNKLFWLKINNELILTELT